MISIEGLSKTYHGSAIEVQALRQVNFKVSRGEMVAVMGPSGSGKSTLLNILGLLDRPDKGEYWLGGERTAALNDNERAEVRNHKIGFVFQAFNLLPRLTAQKNVELPMLYCGVSLRERRKRAGEALERVGLSDRGHHLPNQLSGGQCQRVAIARSLVNKPAIILADEPTGALDSRTGIEIMSLFRELNSEGSTIVLVTHEAEVAAWTARTLHFRDGLFIGEQLNPTGEHPHPAAIAVEGGGIQP
ncbi:MAG: ABC transporter ATP-binding protein [Methylocystaceae bacterium]